MPFTITKLNTVHTGVFIYQPKIDGWIVGPENSYAWCLDEKEYLIDKDNWPSFNEEIFQDFDDRGKLDELKHEVHTLPRLHSDSFCKSTLKPSKTFSWFPEEIFSWFLIYDFIGRMFKLNYPYLLGSDDFFQKTVKKTLGKSTKVSCELYFFSVFHHWELLLQHYQERRFSQKNTFCKTLTQMHTTQFCDKSVIYREGFERTTGNKNSFVADEIPSFLQQSTSPPLVFDSVQNEHYFRPLNVSNRFGTVHYDARILTELYPSINHVFISSTNQELITLHHISELEQTQLLTILTRSVRNSEPIGSYLTGNKINFLYVECSTAWL